MTVLLCIMLFITQMLDWHTTRTILKRPGGQELNPVARWLMSRMTVDGFLAGKVVVVTGLGCAAGQYSPVPLMVLVALYIVVVSYNWRSMP